VDKLYALLERKYSEFVLVNLDPGLPPKKLYDNLVCGPEWFNGDVDVERLSIFFLRHHHPANVPEFSFVSVVKDEVCNAVMSIKSNAAGMDVIPLRFIDLLLPVLLGTLNNVFNHIFGCSEFPPIWGASVVLPIIGQ
jgi:hypothetical protein